MQLWIKWYGCVRELRGACSRQRAFVWMAIVLAAMSVRTECLGVTSFIRSAFLQSACYRRLLHHFHSNALNIEALRGMWFRLAISIFQPVFVDGFMVMIADGLKVAKEGRKMPAVKSLHQESANNSKPPYIMGHSFQIIAMLVNGLGDQMFAVPILSRICEGIVWHSGTKKSLLDKLAGVFLGVLRSDSLKAVLVADAYYASRNVILPLLEKGHHLISRVKTNGVAFAPAPQSDTPGRGRPRVYGQKIRLRNLFGADHLFVSAPSPVYGEKNILIQYRAITLLWRPIGRMIRFVLVKHPTRGNMILLCTALTFDPLTVIRLYGLRFKIEVSFKQALHTIGVYAYHFWMMPMRPIKRGSGNQNLSSKSAEYRQKVRRKMGAYHRYVQLGCIAQGLLQYLAIGYRTSVWASFGSWLRTMKTDMVPSEMVVAQALRTSLPDFLLNSEDNSDLKKFILDHADYDRLPGFKMAA
jgi:hypothetical protein